MHPAVPPIGDPALEVRFIPGQLDAGDADLVEAQRRRDLGQARTPLGELVGSQVACHRAGTGDGRPV